MSEQPPRPPVETAPVQPRVRMGCSMGVWVWVGVVMVSLGVPAAALFFLTTFRMKAQKGFINEAAQQTLKSDEMMMVIALEAYRAAAGNYPTTEQGLDALVQRPAKPPIPNHWYPYLPEVPKDPWKQPYKYRNPAIKSKKGYDLYSVGRDGVDGTADDIGNW